MPNPESSEVKQTMQQTAEHDSSIQIEYASPSIYQETRAMKQNVHDDKDAYSRFLETASSESKDAFYRKLAGVLLKGQEAEKICVD